MSERGNSRFVVFGALVAAAVFGGGLLWWTSLGPPPGSHERVTLSEVWPVTLPAGYAPPSLPPEPTPGSTYLTIERVRPDSFFERTIETDGTVKGLSSVTICVERTNSVKVDCTRGDRHQRNVKTTFEDVTVVISPVNPYAKGVPEWRGIAFTDRLEDLTWLRR